MLLASLTIPAVALAADDAAASGTGDSSTATGDAQDAQPVKNGFVSENGKKHYYKNGVLITSRKVKANGKTYYLNAKGNIVKGNAVKIKGKYWIISNKGKLLKPSKNTIYKLKSGLFYVNKKGNPAKKGWFIKSGKLHYASKAGKLKASGKKQGITFTSKGHAKSNRASKLKMICKRLIAKNTKSSWSKKKKFETMVEWTRHHGEFSMKAAVRDFSNPAWVQRQAYKCFTGKYIMCYGAACEMAMFAFELGYEKPLLIVIPNTHGCVYVDGKRYDWNNPQINMTGGYRFRVISWDATDPATSAGTERAAASAISKKVSAHYSGPYKYKGTYYIFKNGKIANGNGKRALKIKGKVYGVSASGKALKGTYVIKNKFFSFKKNGLKNAKKTSKLRKAGKEGANYKDFVKVAGKPLKTKYVSGSCYGNGDDGISTYKNFYLYTFRSNVTGTEEILSFLSR